MCSIVKWQEPASYGLSGTKGLSTADDEWWLSGAAVLVLTFAGTTHR